MEKMKVLWICNVPLPIIAADMQIDTPNICGWLSGFSDCLMHDTSVELHVAFPITGLKEMKTGCAETIHYYAFNKRKLLGFLPVEDSVHDSILMREHLKMIIDSVSPEILHIFGTEYPHGRVAAECFNRPERTVISIQGLTFFLGDHYLTGIPCKYARKFAISNLIRGNLIEQQKTVKKRGESEKKALNLAGHVIGRTTWDYACTKQINPSAVYHFCNESLRYSFYQDEWKFEKCVRYSIFMSQGSSPIKGLHFMLRALPEIIKTFPQAHLYIAGNNFIKNDRVIDVLKRSSYAKYIKRLIQEYNLWNHITFTGPLTEVKIKDMYLKSNVYVLASTIENSPNSLGEAMCLGVPCVASGVGGVSDMIKHDLEGFVYQVDAPYMLAYYVKKIFELGPDVRMMCMKAREHGLKTHDRKTNYIKLKLIYHRILGV